MFIRTCVKVDARGCERVEAKLHAARTSSDTQGRHSLSLSLAVFLHVSFPPLASRLPSPLSLLPPTRHVVSHALYLETRRARISRSYARSHRSDIAKIYVTLLFISSDGPQDDVSLILAAAMCGPS